MDSVIHPDEKLFRNVKSLPQPWKKETNRPSSALFKDSNGLSVDRGDIRSTEEVVSSLKIRFGEPKAVIVLEATICYDLGLSVLAMPLQDNPYHAEIHESPGQITLNQFAREGTGDSVPNRIPRRYFHVNLATIARTYPHHIPKSTPT